MQPPTQLHAGETAPISLLDNEHALGSDAFVVRHFWQTRSHPFLPKTSAALGNTVS